LELALEGIGINPENTQLQYKLLATFFSSTNSILGTGNEQQFIPFIIEGISSPSKAIHSLCTTTLTRWINQLAKESNIQHKSLVKIQLNYKLKAALLENKPAQFLQTALDNLN